MIKNSLSENLIASQMAALSNPVRLRILRWLAQHEQCQCKDVVDAFPLAQSTVSQHLKVLTEAGLVSVELKLPKSHYRIDRGALAALRQSLDGFVEACCEDGSCKSTEIKSGNNTPGR